MGRFRAYTDSDFSATHTLTASALRPHFHSGYIVGYLFSGRYHCRLRDKQHLEYKPRDIALLNPGEVHQDFSSKHERDYLTLNIQERLFSSGLQDFRSPARTLPSFFLPRLEPDPQLDQIFNGLRHAVDGNGLEREYEIRSLVANLALYLSDQFSQTPRHNEKADLEKATTRWEIRRAMEFLRDTYTQHIDYDRLSKTVGLGKYYFERVFKKATGLSPHQFVIQLRVERAKQLLGSTSKSMVDISMELGFFDQSHFTNAFKNFTGTSPRAYRVATL